MDIWTSFWTALSTPNKLRVGSRKPTEFPVWATPEVTRGGFPTSVMVASIEAPWERYLALEIGVGADGPMDHVRFRINCFFASSAGQKRLMNSLENNLFEASLPEECALLSAAMLNSLGQFDEARKIVEEVCPFFHDLRFYPRMATANPRPDESLVQLWTREQSIASLQERARKRDSVIRRAENKFARRKLQAELVKLLMETVVDDWPLQVFPAGFYERFGKVMAKWRLVASEGSDRCRQLFGLVSVPFKTLTGRQVGLVRQIMKETNLNPVAPEPIVDVASLALCVLQRFQAAEPLDTCVTAEEAARLTLQAGKIIPKSLLRKCLRSTPMPLETLLEKKIIKSAEALAAAVQSLSAVALSETCQDVRLRSLFRIAYRAFRSRRSLLLLRFESQIAIEELPWMLPLLKLVVTPGSEEPCKRALSRLAKLTLWNFPQTLVPNKLVQELIILAKAANFHVPFVQELAADIFQHGVSPRFHEAAVMTSEFCMSSLYGRYFNLEPVLEESDFTDMFHSLAQDLKWDDGSGASGFVAQNGCKIEACQIYTTHNIVPLLQLAGFNVADLFNLATRCFRHVIKMLSFPEQCPSWKVRLQRVKDAAVAWRQMIIYLSHVPDAGAVSEWMLMARGLFSSALDDGFKRRFAPAIEGLQSAINGEPREPHEQRRFTGWTPVTNHWALPPSVRVRFH